MLDFTPGIKPIILKIKRLYKMTLKSKKHNNFK